MLEDKDIEIGKTIWYILNPKRFINYEWNFQPIVQMMILSKKTDTSGLLGPDTLYEVEYLGSDRVIQQTIGLEDLKIHGAKNFNDLKNHPKLFMGSLSITSWDSSFIFEQKSNQGITLEKFETYLKSLISNDLREAIIREIKDKISAENPINVKQIKLHN